jgi:hypothetical protein
MSDVQQGPDRRLLEWCGNDFLKGEMRKMSEEEKTKTKKCRFCFEQINISAFVCRYCGRYQNPVLYYLGRATLLGSILMVLIAYAQLRQAGKEHIAAKDALERARRAEERASSAYDATKEITQALVRITYLKQQTRMEMGGPRLKQIDKLIQDDLNKILRLMLPDPNERRAFVQKLKDDLPKRE